ncbi:MAG: hypothetical protein M3426_02230 [Actinomycetota bacterium]|nr:hypothetical protein [Actinomycetota bacterium]
MINLADFWYTGRHQELLREADQERLARESRRAREARKVATGRPTLFGADRTASSRAVVRRGVPEDAPRIAGLLELNGMPRWVAFEERFIVVEERGKLVAALRFREGPGQLHLGLLVTDPWAEEGSLAVALYAGARATARGLGLREVRARTRRHESHLCEAGYSRFVGGWRSSL